MLYLVFLTTLANGLFFTLPSRKETCIGLEVKNAHDLWGAYVVSGQGDKNVNVIVFDPKNVVEFVNEKDSREGKFHIVKPTWGTHRICFKAMDGVIKTISFELTTEESNENAIATDEELEPFDANLKKITRGLENVNRNLHFYQRREKTHRDLSERTCDRVLWVAGFKFVSLIAVSFLQIWGLKKILSSSSTAKV